MNYRTTFVLSLLIFSVVCPSFARENRVYDFGPIDGQRLVFTAPNRIGSNTVTQLEKLIASFTKTPPPLRVSVILTENDLSELPEELRTGYPAGTNAIIDLLEDDEGGAVIILAPGETNAVVIKNGSAGSTSPRWMLESVTTSLERSSMGWELEDKRMTLYRLGWIPDDPLLAAYLQAGIPALMLKTDSDISEFCLDLTNSFKDGIPQVLDRHYLVERIQGRLYFISEKIMVVGMIFASAIILLFLFVFSFLYGKKSDQHLRDFFRVWWLPFLYLIVNIICLYVGQTLTAFLFSVRFGDSEGWTLIPRLALGGKLIFTWFFITLIISLNQLIHFPEDNFIYGYIASITCMINIFVFSSLDFSLSLLFLMSYVIAFVSYHFRHPALQVLGLIALGLPFMPYLEPLGNGNAQLLAPLYSGENFWNIRMALFIMPFQFLISRLLHTAGNFGRKSRFYLPINLVPVFVLAVGSAAFLLFYPAWSDREPLIVTVRQIIDSNGNRIEKSAPARLGNLILDTDPSMAAAPSLKPESSAFVHVLTSSRKFLERQLVTVSIDPVIPVHRIEITIASDSGLSVYDASIPFELLEGGQKAHFVSPEKPDLPYRFDFSSDIHTNLNATIKVWTRTNPYGLYVKTPGMKADYLLEIDRQINLNSPVSDAEQ